MEVEKEVKRIDAIVKRLARRPAPSLKVVLTPFPISGYCDVPDETGTVLRYLFPSNGYIIGGAIHVDEMPKSGIVLSAILKDDNGERAISYGIRRQSITTDTIVDVEAGSRISVKVSPSDAKEQVRGIWISLLWKPAIPVREKLEEENDDKKLREET